MKIEMHRADWSIPYPTETDEPCVTDLLRPLTYMEHELDVFPWHLADRMIVLLETPEASFEYLHLTSFFRARAAMLVLKGKVLNRPGLHAALSKYQVQIGGIYRKHLLASIRTFLLKHNLGQLPECDIHPLEPTHDPQLMKKNRELIRRIVQAAEIAYLNTLNFISEDPAMTERIEGESVEFWVERKENHRAVNVRVRVTRHKGWYEVKPCPEEAKQLFSDGRTAGTFAVRMQEELPFVREQGGKEEMFDGSPRTTSGSWLMGKRDGHHGQKMETGKNRSTECASHIGGRTERRNMVNGEKTGEKPHATVFGDFNVIMMPNGMKDINLVKKYKARAVLRFIHRRLTETGTSDFYVEEIRTDFNKQFSGNLAYRQWQSDRFREDLFRGGERDFDLLFEPLDKGAGHYRLKVTLLTG